MAAVKNQLPDSGVCRGERAENSSVSQALTEALINLAAASMKSNQWMNLQEITAVCNSHIARGGGRRNKLEMAAIEDAIHYVTEKYNVITLRGLFYQITSKYRLLPKLEKSYAVIARVSGSMRKRGLLAYSKLSDNTRWMRKPTTHKNLATAMKKAHEFYRRDLWASQDCYVEIWCEKDAMAGILYEITKEYDVPLMVSRGYSSLSFLHSAAQTINAANKEDKHAYLYHYGDYDPSGQDIPRAIRETLLVMVDDPTGFSFKTMAVTPEQIKDLQLPTRPTKKSDSRSKNFSEISVELDAIDPDDIQHMVREVIEQHIDQGELANIRKIEKAEKETLEKMIVNL